MNYLFEPFQNAEEVWFWFCGGIISRTEGIRQRGKCLNKNREIEVADVCRILKKMKQHHLITNRDLRIMFKWGCTGCSPYYNSRAKSSEIKSWHKGICGFEMCLKNKGLL